MSATPRTFILRCTAPDAVGILARVTGFLAARQLNIIESHDYADIETRTFFIRVAFNCPSETFEADHFREAFQPVAKTDALDWSLREAAEFPRTLVLVSKADHCLNDLLYRHRRGRLGAEIVAIVSNHEEAEWHASRHDLPFFHVPVTEATKAEAETRLRELISETRSELVVLARYMQILSSDLAHDLQGSSINIHHSFLPSFKGARPYHQAHMRGVKLIGATAHYVTTDLDEGPIITQDAVAVDHRATPEKLVSIGRDIEARVLSRAVKAHAEGRVFLNGARTVVFE